MQGNSQIEIGGVSNVEIIDTFFFARNGQCYSVATSYTRPSSRTNLLGGVNLGAMRQLGV
jgi:hypothetical protein